MSTTEPIHKQESRSVFNHRIYENRNICDNCYSKTHNLQARYDPANLPKSLRGVLNSRVEQEESETIYYQAHSVSEGIATICSRCESEAEWYWTVEDLTKSQSIKAVRNLYKRLQQEGDIEVEYSDLYEETKRRVLDPSKQDKSVTEVFRNSVDEVARIRPQPDVEEAISPQEGEVIVDFDDGGTTAFDASKTTVTNDGVEVLNDNISFLYDLDNINRIVEPPDNE